MTMRLFIALLLCGLFLSGCQDRTISVQEAPISIVKDKPGRGRTASKGRLINIDYKVALPDGSIVLTHKDWEFVVGSGSVITGIDEGVLGMRVGGQRIINCPPHKHWGRNGYANGKIPPNTNLMLHIKLNRVEDPM